MDPKTNLITTIEELKVSIEEGDVDKLKANINRFHQDLENNKQGLKELYESGNQCASQTALILAACRSNQADTLYYLLYETDILNHFPGADFDDKDVQTQRTEAFKLALICDAFNVVDMLYDYWSGDLHWIGHDINKLKMLGKMLKDAHDPDDVKNQQLLIDMNCLIKFNDFQQKLYSSITDIKSEKTAEMLVEVLRIYDEYSDEHKVIIPHVNEEIEREQKASLDDKTSECFRMQFYIKYIVYFRKLDFNVALLILENWFIFRKLLKDRFNQPVEYFTKNPTVKSSYKKAVSLYKDIECILFHFIYRTWDDWRLYLPRNRHITVEEHHTGIHKGKTIENLKIKYDEHTWNNGPVLFLERKSFCDHVKELKILLEENIISVDPAKNWKQNYKMENPSDICILLDDNYLTPTDTTTSTNNPTNTNMRDFYSLSKIVYHIKAIENTKDSDDNDDNDDIDDDNVLMIERVLQVTGEMSKSTPDANHLSDSAISLLQIAISIDTVKHLSYIRKFLSHAEDGQFSKRDDIVKSNRKLFHDIRQDLIIIKQQITPVLDICKKILDKALLEQGLTLLDKQIETKNLPHKQHIECYYKIHGSKLFNSETSEVLIERLNVETDLPIQLLNEIIWIHYNRDSILQKIELAKISIGEKIVGILPIYIQNIRQVLAAIDENNKNVNLINQELGRCNMKKIKKGMPNNPDSVTIAKMRLLITDRMKINDKKDNIDYDTIQRTLRGIKVFSDHLVAIRKMLSFCYDECHRLGPKPEIQNNVLSVTAILKDLDSKCKLDKNVVKNHTFDAIKNLHDIFKNHKGSGIEQDQIKSFLIRRVDCLKRILPCSGEKNLRKYKNDHKFRLLLEMVLADIGNLFTACKTKDVMNKSNMLLREINLGNVLDHGNPFLDVIAEVFDPYDLSMGLLSKAEMLAEHGESIIQNLPIKYYK